MATAITRLRYPSYRGKESEDPDSFVEEFNQTASANREAQDDDKLRIFPALLKGRGSHWVVALALAEKTTWTAPRKAFLSEFRSLGFNKQVYNRLATLEKKKKESLRTYTQRFRDLVNRLTNKPDDEQAVEWYIGGLPTDLAFQCQLGPQSTIAEVIATAKKYETARRSARVKKHKSRKASYSSSEEEETSTSESSSSESDRSSSRRSKPSARRKKKNAKRRDSSEESSSSEEERRPSSSSKRKSKTDKGSMDALMREMADLKVQLASVKDKRKSPAAPRHNLWCSNCHVTGHTKDDCRLSKGAGSQVNWIEEGKSPEDSYYAEGADGQVYHINLSSSSGPRFSAPRAHFTALSETYSSRPKVNFVDTASTSGTKNEVHVQLAYWDGTKKEEQSLHSNEGLATQVRFDPRVMDIPSNEDLWPSDSAWNSFGVSTRSKKPSAKEESKSKNKKEKGKKVREKPVVESDSDSDTPPMTPVKYKDDISNVVRTALEEAQDTVNPSEQTPVEVLSVPTLPSSLSATPRVLDSKVSVPISTNLDYDFVEDLARPPARISMLQLLVTCPYKIRELSAWSRGRKKVRQGLRVRKKKIIKDEKEPSAAAYTIIEEDRGSPEVDIEIRGCLIRKPEDDHGYEVLVGRPWLYGARVIIDWARKQATFPTPGSKD
ncbi:hypothetical protein R1sor_000318 [Riccia sorocarpa]|uniref:Retrotransposon gag domain-containing protein n=1 Tax=Riccia sorocarpa TaxID=122646 RepID=A0ABD3GUG0_9MARC